MHNSLSLNRLQSRCIHGKILAHLRGCPLLRPPLCAESQVAYDGLGGFDRRQCMDLMVTNHSLSEAKV